VHKNKLAALVSLLLACGSAVAHEFWIQPAQFRPDNNAVLGVQLRVGDGFPGEPRPRDPNRLRRFVAISPDGTEDVAGIDGRDPAGLLRLKAVGVHVLAYESSASVIELDAEKFESYLKDEGLEAIIEQRAALGESAASAKEAFSRCAKSLICCERSNAAEVWKKPVGLKLELIPDADPYASTPGDKASYVLLADGKPVEGALVRAASSRGKPGEWQKARTDKDGRVTFTLADSGPWLLSSVRMERAAEGEDVQWKSTWASLTFEVPGPDTKGPAGQPIPKPATPTPVPSAQ
jgi:uncharacterized GH25 family protein